MNSPIPVHLYTTSVQMTKIILSVTNISKTSKSNFLKYYPLLYDFPVNGWKHKLENTASTLIFCTLKKLQQFLCSINCKKTVLIINSPCVTK